jgi:hypothetical protein
VPRHAAIAGKASRAPQIGQRPRSNASLRRQFDSRKSQFGAEIRELGNQYARQQWRVTDSGKIQRPSLDGLRPSQFSTVIAASRPNALCLPHPDTQPRLLMHRSLLVAAAAACVCAAPAWGASFTNGLAVGVSAGTLGTGLSVAKAIEPGRLSVELDLNALTLSHSYSNSGVNYNGSLRLQSAGAVANYFPWASAFHVSAGLFYDNNRFNLNGQPTSGSFTLNGRTYSSAELSSLSGQVKFNTIAPYLGVGWGDATAHAGWHLIANFGVLYQGRPKVSLVGDTTYPQGSQYYSALYSNIDAQRQQIQNDLSSLRWYPVASIGVQYRF